MVDKTSPMICTYCGKVKAPWDDDHIPPRCVIGADHDHTVPSCIDCNRGASKDDEYFLFAITMAKSCDEHPNISKVREGVFRSLGKEHARSYRDLILRNVDSTTIGPDGVDFGNYLQRIKAVASRIVKGLYFRTHGGVRLPDTYPVTVFVGNEYVAYGQENEKKFRSLFQRLLSADKKTIGAPGVFSYVHATVDGQDPFATVWYFQFYGGYDIFAWTLLTDDPRAPATHFPQIHNMHLLPKLSTTFIPSCGKLSAWVTSQLGDKLEPRSSEPTELSKGVQFVLRGRLGKHSE